MSRSELSYVTFITMQVTAYSLIQQAMNRSIIGRRFEVILMLATIIKFCAIINNNHPPASTWQPECDRKQGNYLWWPYSINSAKTGLCL